MKDRRSPQFAHEPAGEPKKGAASGLRAKGPEPPWKGAASGLSPEVPQGATSELLLNLVSPGAAGAGFELHVANLVGVDLGRRVGARRQGGEAAGWFRGYAWGEDPGRNAVGGGRREGRGRWGRSGHRRGGRGRDLT